MFKVFDESRNELTFPGGVTPQEIFIGSISKNRHTEEVPGRSGIVDYGFDYVDRPVELYMWARSQNRIDYRLMRNEIYEMFDKGKVLYIAESEVPTRVLKVVVDDAYTPNRFTAEFAEVDVTCRTLDEVFWQSIFTTKELNDDGMDAIEEKYGLADGINSDYTQYRFTSSSFDVWNGGNVTIEPESMMLDIRIGAVTTDGSFTLKNITTGDVFEFTKAVDSRNIFIRGMSVSEGSYNALRDTNRRFISIRPGLNQFEISGGTFDDISIDFRYLYK